MTEVAIRTESAPALPDYQSVAVARLAEWAQSADAAYEIAGKLVQSSFVPASFKGKAVEATAAILAGLEVGLQPMAALRSFDVIQGQAAPRAITLRAIVQSFGHQVEVVESNATRCRMRGKRRGSDAWQSVTWTMDRARDLQLTGKDNWKKQPQAMLVARATSEICRLIAADAILGIGYTAEEIVDGVETIGDTAEGATPEPAAATTRKMSRRKTEPVEDPEPVEAVEMITDAQMRRMQAAFTEQGMGREQRLAYVSMLLERDVESSKDLTKDEASRVIDSLSGTSDEEPTPEAPDDPA